MNQPIYITGIASVSALGSTQQKIWNAYLEDTHRISKKNLMENQLL